MKMKYMFLKYNKNFDLFGNNPDIIGTLYSIGMFRDGAKPRKPHAHPKANWFGREVSGAIGLFVVFNK